MNEWRALVGFLVFAASPGVIGACLAGVWPLWLLVVIVPVAIAGFVEWARWYMTRPLLRSDYGGNDAD